MATENIKTASEVVTEFLDAQSKDEALDVATVAAVSTLFKDDDLSKIKLLRKLEDARKATLKADVASVGDAGND